MMKTRIHHRCLLLERKDHSQPLCYSATLRGLGSRKQAPMLPRGQCTIWQAVLVLRGGWEDRQLSTESATGDVRAAGGDLFFGWAWGEGRDGGGVKSRLNHQCGLGCVQFLGLRKTANLPAKAEYRTLPVTLPEVTDKEKEM